MNYKKNAWRDLALKGAAAVLLFGASGLAFADQFGLQVSGGLGDRQVKRLDLALAWDPGLTWWQIGDWHFSLVGEANAGWWHTDEGNVHHDIGEFGLTPFVRFIKGAGLIRPYVELGAGIRLLTSPRLTSTFTLGTAFEFTEEAGAGLQFGSHQQYQAGYRFQHISNGGIKEPNPGINFHQLYLQYNF